MHVPSPSKWGLALIATGAAVGGVAVAGEIAVRLLHPEATRPYLVNEITGQLHGWAHPDPLFHHVGDGIYHLNFPKATDSGPPRIMLVGDSFVMGHGVGEAKRFGTLLQQDLGDKARVAVLATSSYSPIIYRSIVRTALNEAPYAAAVVFVDQTDPGDELAYQHDLAGGSSGMFDMPRMQHRADVVHAAYEAMLRSVERWNSPRRLAMLNYIQPMHPIDMLDPTDENYHTLELATTRPVDFVREFNTEPDAAESREMLTLVQTHLDEIVAMCEAQHVPLILTANPWEVQSSRHPRVTRGIPGPYPAENRLEDLLVERYGKRAGVYVMRMTAAFRAAADPSELFLPAPTNEIHWNAAGHAFVERILREFLETTVHIPGVVNITRQ